MPTINAINDAAASGLNGNAFDTGKNSNKNGEIISIKNIPAKAILWKITGNFSPNQPRMEGIGWYIKNPFMYALSLLEWPMNFILPKPKTTRNNNQRNKNDSNNEGFSKTRKLL